MPFKLAVVGLGKIARDQHLPVIAADPAFELAAVVSSRSRVEGVPVFRTLGELLASGPAVDAVALCMPPGPRFAAARDALDAGRHVLMEKPPTPTVGELDALRELAAARGRVLFTTWHSQYNPAVDEARRRLAGKTVTALRVTWREDVRHWHPGQDWVWEPGGFGVFDPGVNAFSIVTRVLPEPVFVESCTLETPADRATPIAARVRFKPSWAGEADLSADLDWRQTGEQTWDIDISTADGPRLHLRKGGSELFADGALVVGPAGSGHAEYAGIYRHFAELLAAGRSHVDAAPLRLVADCFLLGRRVDTHPFAW